MNINELNSIADNIRSVDAKARSATLDSVRKYGIERHNEMVLMMKEVYEFVEKNLDLFEPCGITWNGSRNKLRYTNHNIGNTNNYNCVIRDFNHEQYNSGERIYWVDDGIIFRIRTIDNRVCLLTDCDKGDLHGYGDDAKVWNDSYDFTQFNHPIGSGCANSFRYGIFAPEWNKMFWTDKNFPVKLDEFSVSTFKKAVDDDYEHAKKVVERLTYTLKKINESVVARQSVVNATLDGVKSAEVCKYVVEIRKIEQ